jgi:hypothetical protein
MNMQKALIIFVITSLATPLVKAINYLELERAASKVACNTTPQSCVVFVEPDRTVTGKAITQYKLEGRIMPTDALRDDDLQRQMLPANLYVKKDGSVALLYEVKESEYVITVEEKSTVLPFKNFDISPDISGFDDKIIISTGREE